MRVESRHWGKRNARSREIAVVGGKTGWVSLEVWGVDNWNLGAEGWLQFEFELLRAYLLQRALLCLDVRLWEETTLRKECVCMCIYTWVCVCLYVCVWSMFKFDLWLCSFVQKPVYSRKCNKSAVAMRWGRGQGHGRNGQQQMRRKKIFWRWSWCREHTYLSKTH